MIIMLVFGLATTRCRLPPLMISVDAGIQKKLWIRYYRAEDGLGETAPSSQSVEPGPRLLLVDALFCTFPESRLATGSGDVVSLAAPAALPPNKGRSAIDSGVGASPSRAPGVLIGLGAKSVRACAAKLSR